MSRRIPAAAEPRDEKNRGHQPKKPYSPPSLKRLGSVRELTLSGGATVPEGSMGFSLSM